MLFGRLDADGEDDDGDALGVEASLDAKDGVVV